MRLSRQPANAAATSRKAKPEKLTADGIRKTSPDWLVYMLRCGDGSLYTGITNDLAKRLKAHAAGKASRYTRSRLPVKLAYTEPQRSKSAALKREAAIKRLTRAAKHRLVAKR